MPYISTKVSCPISPEKETVLKAKMGRAIETIPGKTEDYLMTSFEDNCHLWMHGDNSVDSAYVEVKIFGSAAKESYSAMTKVICNILKDELNINPDRVYVTYSEYDSWGWNNFNF